MKYQATSFSKDGTIKYLFGVTSGHGKKIVEAAFLHIPNRDDSKPEYILCLSSMVGCVYSCRMCANMFNPFDRCLSPDEINEQIKLTLGQDGNLEKITREGAVEYAFMAIGEPLFGMNVIQAIQKHKAHVPDTRFALSTVGSPGTIRKLTGSSLPYPVRLELSLHFPNDTLRNQWMSDVLNMHLDKLPDLNIEQALQEAEEYAQKHHGKITLNYALIDGVNNTDQSLDQLERLLRNRKDTFYVKVMKPNLTSSLVYSWKDELGVKRTYSPIQFKKELLKRGITATTFESKGTDIYAGCGMMAGRFENAKGVFVPPQIPEADASQIGFK